jgi:hypothetical protein
MSGGSQRGVTTLKPDATDHLPRSMAGFSALDEWFASGNGVYRKQTADRRARFLVPIIVPATITASLAGSGAGRSIQPAPFGGEATMGADRRDDARVGDGDAQYVSCKITQHGLVTLAPMVDVDEPGLVPAFAADRRTH